jgi:two-component system, chemotaxis family, response regulator WspR
MFEAECSAHASVSPARDAGDVVLLVDDQPMIGEAIRRMLSDQSELEFHYCRDAATAVAVAERVRPTVILQDLVMPGIDGLELVNQYRANPATKNISIVVLSSNEDPATKRDAFRGGANDYLVKLPDKIELVARIRLHSRAYLNQIQRDEAFRSLSESQAQLVATNLTLAERVDELQAARDELARIVSTDALTGLSSRGHWLKVAETEFARHRRHLRPLTFLMADLDFFKNVNDTYGHEVGDEVLKGFAHAVRSACRNIDLCGRLGGEEFALLLPETSVAGGVPVAKRIVEKCRSMEIFTPAGILTCSCSVGVAELEDGDGSMEDLLRRADMALYDAKRNGRDGWRVRAQSAEQVPVVVR